MFPRNKRAEAAVQVTPNAPPAGCAPLAEQQLNATEQFMLTLVARLCANPLGIVSR
ncbi:hypothetical protein CHELA1G11_11736 [Hyphomicrobiales bacterium]|nr:hypothetical protein CHELA1G11_11736 [Hyphomicrobiales bacterium]CAH1665709.1 hypothetical protein CHELA1G2_12570 [Hyphomicrobiales bacterium]